MQASGMPSNKRIGELLIERGHITEAQLKEALEYQRTKGGRVGWILVSLGRINRLQLFETVACQHGIEFRTDRENLVKQADRSLLLKIEFHEAIEQQSLPFMMEGSCLTLLTAYAGDEQIHDFFKSRFSAASIKEILITDLDLMKMTEEIYRDVILEKSIFDLYKKNPEGSAYSVFTEPQLAVLAAGILIILLWAYHNVLSLLIFSNLMAQIFYSIAIGFKLLLSLAGMRREIDQPVMDEEITALKDEDLPVYSIVVPVYKEPEVIGILIDSLKKLDYPQNRLDIILLLEDDDSATLESARARKPPGNWRFLVIPPSLPKTKPKACNYGLFFSRGKYLVIYDAEDIPEPDQLKKAVAAFKKGGDSYVCFQAALNYFNRDENFLTRMFTLEYSYWFDYILPGLDRLKLPIPLGGTSNHFDTSKLLRLGGWDPFNTTEDADLGIRAYTEGWKVGVINTTTFEEANAHLGNWLRQRSRWIKGYMQTWLVYSRHPFRLYRSIGLKSWLAFNFFIGGSVLMSLINPITWGIFGFWLVTSTKLLDALFPPVVLYLSLANLLFGNFLGIYLNMTAVFKRRYHALFLYAYLNPVYWMLHSIAAYKALWQLFTKPFYWEKTQHGITKQRAISG